MNPYLRKAIEEGHIPNPIHAFVKDFGIMGTYQVQCPQDFIEAPKSSIWDLLPFTTMEFTFRKESNPFRIEEIIIVSNQEMQVRGLPGFGPQILNSLAKQINTLIDIDIKSLQPVADLLEPFPKAREYWENVMEAYDGAAGREEKMALTLTRANRVAEVYSPTDDIHWKTRIDVPKISGFAKPADIIRDLSGFALNMVHDHLSDGREYVAMDPTRYVGIVVLYKASVEQQLSRWPMGDPMREQFLESWKTMNPGKSIKAETPQYIYTNLVETPSMIDMAELERRSLADDPITRGLFSWSLSFLGGLTHAYKHKVTVTARRKKKKKSRRRGTSNFIQVLKYDKERAGFITRKSLPSESDIGSGTKTAHDRAAHYYHPWVRESSLKDGEQGLDIKMGSNGAILYKVKRPRKGAAVNGGGNTTTQGVIRGT